MKINKTKWNKYINRLAEINEKAAAEFRAAYNAERFKTFDQMADFAFALATKYGEACGALACEIIDEIALAQGVNVPPALPAQTATRKEVATALLGANLSPEILGPAVGRLVKQAGADTMLQNAKRFGAQYAWIPAGKSCAYCLAIASQGWHDASHLQSTRAKHIHNNCKCEFCIDFKGGLSVEGYNPESLQEEYYTADGKNSNDKINYLRRKQYAENKDKINEQKRAAYAARQARNNVDE